MNRKVVIVGASGHGRVIADIVRACNDTVLGFLDDDINKETLGTISDWEKYKDNEFIIGIGDSEIRDSISKTMDRAHWYTAIHPSAIISSSVVIGEGTVVMPNAVINAGSIVGRHTIINSGAIVEHDNQIGEFSHISVGAKLGGTVSIGNYTWVGIGAVVGNNKNVCDNCIIGAGAVVVKDIFEAGIYIGVPAKIYAGGGISPLA